jgi:hypothetical protein
MMTEEEAKTKWCPHSFFTGKDAEVSGNREYFWDEDRLPKCMGSACMAWRWAHKKGDFVPTEIVRDLHGEKITYKMADDDMGFCGLAGKP